MYGMKGEVPDEPDFILPIGVGERKRAGHDVTIVTWGRVLHKAMEASVLLAKEGIEVDLLDPRTLVPLDEALIFESVRKTHRVVIVEESWPFSSVGSQISDRIQSECFDDLDAPVARVCQEAVPVPYAEHLEERALPSVARIVEAVKRVCYRA